MDDQLIEEVRQNACLYSLEDPNYKNLLYKEPPCQMAWATIAQRLNIDVEQCKKRWRYLRDTKRRSCNRMQLPSGSAAPTKRQWIHAESMAFLDDTKCCRRTIVSLPQPEVFEERPSSSSHQAKVPISEFSPPMAPHIAVTDVSPQILVTDSSPSPSPLPSPTPLPSPSPSHSPGFMTSWQRRKMRKQANEKD